MKRPRGKILWTGPWVDVHGIRYKRAFQTFIRFEPRDMWWGLYWDHKPGEDGVGTDWDFFVIVIPMFPIHITGYTLPHE